MNEPNSATRDPNVPAVRSLADIRRGETVRIRGILFGALRELCRNIGIQEGDDVRCRGASRAALLLETVDGRTAVLDSDWARFIQISATGQVLPAQKSRQASTAASWRRSADINDR